MSGGDDEEHGLMWVDMEGVFFLVLKRKISGKSLGSHRKRKPFVSIVKFSSSRSLNFYVSEEKYTTETN